MANNCDNFVNVRNRQGKTNQDVRPIARFVQIELGPAGHNFFAEANEGLQNLAQVELLWTSAIQRKNIGWETRPQLRITMQLVQHDFSARVFLNFNHDPNAMTVRFVAKIGNAFNSLVANHAGNLLDQRRLVHLERNFSDNDGLTTIAHLFDFGARLHND